jgi:large subunit ribosomal protein L29
MKVSELRDLETDELVNRLRASRRELYELRFKLAVGQLEDHQQVRKARKDIARILTLIHQRDRDLEPGGQGDVETASAPRGVAERDTEAAAPQETTVEARAEDAPRARRRAGGRRPAAESRPSIDTEGGEDGSAAEESGE